MLWAIIIVIFLNGQPVGKLISQNKWSSENECKEHLAQTDVEALKASLPPQLKGAKLTAECSTDGVDL